MLKDKTVLSRKKTLADNGIVASTTLVCEETKKMRTQSFVVKVYTEGEGTEDYTCQFSDTPADLIEQYVGYYDPIYYVKTSSNQILKSDRSLVSQGVTPNSTLEGKNSGVY